MHATNPRTIANIPRKRLYPLFCRRQVILAIIPLEYAPLEFGRVDFRGLELKGVAGGSELDSPW